MRSNHPSWDWESIVKDLGRLISEGHQSEATNKNYGLKIKLIPSETLFKLIVLMRSRTLEFFQTGDDCLFFMGRKEKIISQLTALKHDLQQIEIVFSEWVLVEKSTKEEWDQLFNEYMLQYAQGDHSLEQIFWGKLS